MKRPPGLYLVIVSAFIWIRVQDTYGIRATSLIFAKTSTSAPGAESASALKDAVTDANATAAAESNGNEQPSINSSLPTKPTLTGIPQIDYVWDPNLPQELNGYNLSDYPFYERVPDEEFDFKCDGLHDGFYASVPHKCQVYHHCLYGTRYDFLCANYTAFDQKTFICQFVSVVDCVNSKKYWHRNDALYQAATTSTSSTTTTTTTTTTTPTPAVAQRRPLGNGGRRRPSRRRPYYNYYDDYAEDDYDYEVRLPPRRRLRNRHHRPITYDDDYDYELEDRKPPPRRKSLNRAKDRRKYAGDVSAVRHNDKIEEQEQSEDDKPLPVSKPNSSSSIYNRPRALPKIKPPVPKNAANRYAPKTTSTSSTTTSVAPPHRPNAEYYDEYDEPAPTIQKKAIRNRYRGKPMPHFDTDDSDPYLDDASSQTQSKETPSSRLKRPPPPRKYSKRPTNVRQEDEDVVLYENDDLIQNEKVVVAPKLKRPVVLDPPRKPLLHRSSATTERIKPKPQYADYAEPEYDDPEIEDEQTETEQKGGPVAPQKAIIEIHRTAELSSSDRLHEPAKRLPSRPTKVYESSVQGTVPIASVFAKPQKVLNSEPTVEQNVPASKIYKSSYEDSRQAPEQKVPPTILYDRSNDKSRSEYEHQDQTRRRPTATVSSQIEQENHSTSQNTEDSTRSRLSRPEYHSHHLRGGNNRPITEKPTTSTRAPVRIVAAELEGDDGQMDYEGKPLETEEYYEEYEVVEVKPAPTTQAPRTEPPAVMRVPKRPFLPSRGGNPYIGRGLQPIGLMARDNIEIILPSNTPTTTTTSTTTTTTTPTPLTSLDLVEEYDVTLNDALNPTLRTRFPDYGHVYTNGQPQRPRYALISDYHHVAQAARPVRLAKLQQRYYNAHLFAMADRGNDEGAASNRNS